MRHLFPRLRATIAAFSLVFLAAVPSAGATTMEAMSLAELTSEASYIVVGTVRSRRSQFDEFGRIVTDHRIEVEEVWKGEKHTRELLMRSLGGDIGDLGMTVPGAPHLGVGERALFFLRPSALAGAAWHKALGMSQGVLRILPTVVQGTTVPTVHPGGGGLRLLRIGPDGEPELAPPAIGSPSALDEVRSAVARHLSTTNGTLKP